MVRSGGLGLEAHDWLLGTGRSDPSVSCLFRDSGSGCTYQTDEPHKPEHALSAVVGGRRRCSKEHETAIRMTEGHDRHLIVSFRWELSNSLSLSNADYW